jgi:signal transduction histidine kinase
MQTVSQTLAEARYPLNETVLAQIKAFSGLDLLAWDGTANSTLARTDPDLLKHAQNATSDEIHLQGPVMIDGRRYRLAAVRLPLRPAGVRNSVVLLYPEERWQEILSKTAQPVLALAALGGCIAIGLIALVSLRLSRRIGKLQAHTRSIATGDYRPITIPGVRDEIADLCVSINEMAAELSLLHESVKAAERLRLVDQISGGLAHQLRNNIAGARLAVQVHLREQPPEIETDALEVALRQLTLLQERLDGYLDLGNEQQRERRECSLDAIVDEVVNLFRPRCRHFHIALTWQLPLQQVVLFAFRDQIHQLVVNLIDNAIDAAGPDGTVIVTLDSGASHDPNAAGIDAILQVKDSGPGPDAGIASRLFEPFATSKEGGVGLGLSIAARVAKAHAGSLRWYRDDAWTIFEARLPCHRGDARMDETSTPVTSAH